MNDQIFADGIGSISVIGATVRLDFFAFSPTEKEANGQPKAVLQHRLVLPIPGFLHAAGKIQEAVEAISKIGATTLAPVSEPGIGKDPIGQEEAKPSPQAPTKKISNPPFP